MTDTEPSGRKLPARVATFPHRGIIGCRRTTGGPTCSTETAVECWEPFKPTLHCRRTVTLSPGLIAPGRPRTIIWIRRSTAQAQLTELEATADCHCASGHAATSSQS